MRHRQTASLPERYPSIPPTRHRAASLSTSIDTSVHVCVSNSLPKGTTLDPPPIELPPARRRRFVALRRSRKAEVKSFDAIVVRSVVVNGAQTRCKLPLFSLEENSYKKALPAQPTSTWLPLQPTPFPWRSPSPELLCQLPVRITHRSLPTRWLCVLFDLRRRITAKLQRRTITSCLGIGLRRYPSSSTRHQTTPANSQINFCIFSTP